MKKLAPLLLALFLGCKENKNPIPAASQLSPAQTGIQHIVDSFKSDYSTATTDALRDSAIDKYNRRLFDFLGTHPIDSIRVHVDTVIINNLSITTKFHSNDDIAFQYTMEFQEKMNKSWDSIYNFMKNLQTGSDTIVSFAYMGSHQLIDPADETQPTLKIFAFPVPKLSKEE